MVWCISSFITYFYRGFGYARWLFLVLWAFASLMGKSLGMDRVNMVVNGEKKSVMLKIKI